MGVRVIAGIVVVLLGALGLGQASTGLMSRQYEFKPGVILEIAASTEDGLRLDNIRFQVPSKVSGKILRVSGLFTAEVAVSNMSGSPTKVGVAIALFDPEGRLVGVASGGNRLGAIKAGRQKSFTLVFDDVNSFFDAAKTFQITIESEP